MEKKFLRILSFVMVAMFAFTIMGLIVGAEEWEFPAIVEVDEDELGEGPVEEEFVAIYGAGDVAVVGKNAYATLDDALAASSDGEEIIIVGEASITDKAVSNRRFLVKEGASLTITDGTVTGYNGSKAAIEAERGAVVTLNGVTVTENYSGSLRRGAVFMAAGSRLYIGGNTTVTMNRQAKLFDDAGKLDTNIIGSYDNIRLVGSNILTVKADFTGNVGLWNASVANDGKVSASYDFEIGLVEEGYTGAGTIFHDNYGGTTRISEGKLLWEAECKIGEVEYPFLDRAIEVQNSSSNVTIELLKDININEHDGALTILSKGKLVIDGGTNKYTINCVGKDRSTPGSIYANKEKRHDKGSITVGGTELTISNINITREYNRSYGFFKTGGTKAATIIVSDNTFIGGNESKKLSGGNGSVAFLDVSGSEFILNGQNAKIEHVQDNNYGAIAAYGTNTKVTINNGTIANVTSNNGCIGLGNETSFEMTGGIVESASNGRAVYFVTGTTSADIKGGTIGGVLAKGNATITASDATLGDITLNNSATITATNGTLGDITLNNSATITATNGTLGDITLNDSSKLIATGITAGKLTATTASADAVPEVTLNGANVGVVTLDDASKGTVPKLKLSGRINATSISMTLSDAIVLAGSIISDEAIPVSVAERSIRFGTTEDVDYKGAEYFVNKANTKVEGRRYEPGTSFANENTRKTINNRNVGRETALIFDYSFIKVLNDETDFFKGTGYGEGVAKTASVPGESLVNAFETGYTVYMLKDVSCYEDVYESVAKVNNVNYYNHTNMTGSSTVRILDGNGFTLIGDGSGGEDNANYASTSHVFRFYNSTNITFKNFTFDGKGFKKFANAEYTNEKLGGNVTLENCWIKNTISGSISFSDGTFTIRNSIIENCSGTHTIHVRVPKKAGESTTLVISDSSIINNKVGTSASAAAVLIENGATANVSGNINISGNTLNDDTVANVKTSGTNAIKVVGDLTGTMYISNTSGSHIGEVVSGSVAEGVILGDAKYETGSYSVPFTVNGAEKKISYKTYKNLDYLRQDNNIYLVAECYLNNDGLGKTTSFYHAMGSVAADGTIHLLKDINIAEARNDQGGWNFARMIPYTIDGNGHTLTLGQTVESTSEHGAVSKQLIANIQLYGTHINFKNVILDAKGSTGSYLFTITGGAKVSFTDGTVIKNYNCNGGTSHGLIVVHTQSHGLNTDKEAIYAGKAIFNNAKVINCNAPNGQLIRLNAATKLATPQVQLEINNSSFTDGNYSNVINMNTKTQAIINGSNFKNISGRLVSTAGNSLTITDTDIEDMGLIGKNVNGGVLSMSNCTVTLKNVTIKNCKAVHTENNGSTAGGFVFVNSGTINADKLVIDGCVAGTQGSAMYIANGTVNLDNTEIKNCNVASMSETYGGALKVMGEAKLLVDGKTIITNNTQGAEGSAVTSNIDITSGGTLIIADDFTGNIKVKGEAEKIVAGEGFTTLNSVESITQDQKANFAYYDEATGKFDWTTVDLTLATDSGKYDDGTGLVRFMTTFTKAPINAVENYGTYVIGESVFEGDPTAIENFGIFYKAPTEDGQAYIVDVTNIPSNKMEEDITAISFVKIKGITTPIYSYFKTVNFNTAAANGVVKDLGEKA